MNAPEQEYSTPGPSKANDEASSVPQEIDIIIWNTMCTFRVRCHLNLKDIALRGFNVEYRKGGQDVVMRIRRPMAVAMIQSTGRVTVTGAPNEELAKIASKKVARSLQRLGYKVHFTRFKVHNVFATCSLPFGVQLAEFAQHYKEQASYEPELHPGATFKMKHLKASLTVFQTGSITMTADSTANVQLAIQGIYPLVYEFQRPKLNADIECPIPKKPKRGKQKIKRKVTNGQAPGEANPLYGNVESSDTSAESPNQE